VYHKDLSAYKNSTKGQCGTCEWVKPLPTVESNLLAWYNIISNAKKDILITTFVFAPSTQNSVILNEFDVVTPQVWYLGYAMLNAVAKRNVNVNVNKAPIRVTFVLNCTRNAVAKNRANIATATRAWKSIGLDIRNPGECGLYVDWYMWEHMQVNNNHIKMVLVDDKLSCVYSGNIELNSHGGPESWVESGFIVSGKSVNRECRRVAAKLIKRCRKIKSREWSRLVANSIAVYPKLESELTRTWQMNDGSLCDIQRLNRSRSLSDISLLYQGSTGVSNVEVRVCHKMEHASVFSTVRNAEPILQIVDLIRNAKKSVWIVTPTFSDIIVIEEIIKCADRGVSVKICAGYRANELFLAKLLVGCEYNRVIFNEYFVKHADIQFRWFAEPLTKKVYKGVKVHSKVMVVDDEHVFSGSTNMDILATIHSTEMDLYMRGKDLAAQVLDEIIYPLWRSGVSAHTKTFDVKPSHRFIKRP
jgi:phosphatidylserine/phosphatidylglycerophosphate/cardiolipin synthase-like enzyme